MVPNLLFYPLLLVALVLICLLLHVGWPTPPSTTARVHSRWRDCANRRLR
jgi:hypothetical protein